METFYTLIVQVITEMDAFIKIDWTLYLKWIYFIACKLYPNKGDKKINDSGPVTKLLT